MVNNKILMHSTHNEGKPVIPESFIRTLKAKIYRKMAANNSKSYLSYLNKLLDQYNNTYNHSVNKKSANADDSAQTKKIETNPKTRNFKINDSVRTTNYNKFFSKCYTENWSRQIFIINSVLKINPWSYKIKDLNKEKMLENFYEKQLLLQVLVHLI